MFQYSFSKRRSRIRILLIIRSLHTDISAPDLGTTRLCKLLIIKHFTKSIVFYTPDLVTFGHFPAFSLNSFFYRVNVSIGSIHNWGTIMSAKHVYTTADYVPFGVATNLVRRLYRDGNYRMSLLIGCGIFFGLRISDLLSLKWSDILNKDSFVIWEQKTGKRREIRINRGFAGHITDCHQALRIRDDNQSCFLNRYGGVISIQRVNRAFNEIKVRYQVPAPHFSTHSLRKTWARRIYENENMLGKGEMALLKLSELMNYSAPDITRRYIGLRREELGEVYDCLTF